MTIKVILPFEYYLNIATCEIHWLWEVVFHDHLAIGPGNGNSSLLNGHLSQNFGVSIARFVDRYPDIPRISLGFVMICWGVCLFPTGRSIHTVGSHGEAFVKTVKFV